MTSTQSTPSTSKPMMKRTGVIALVLIAIAVIAGVAVYYVAFRPGSGTCGNSVNLGAAANFAVLGGSAVTNTGSTNVTGDVGVSPGTSFTAFPPGTVNGNKHITDTTAASAQSDETTAFTAANALTGATGVAGNIGGQTLTCGLYKSTSSLAISSGDLTLDAQGNGNNVFIFQISSTLTTTTGLKVILAGGAQAKNIFWIVGSAATLGTNSVLYGTILAYSGVSLTTGATLNGRAIAQSGGAVTLQSNTITKP